jgi:trehalose 2-sulfotransferase
MLAVSAFVLTRPLRAMPTCRYFPAMTLDEQFDSSNWPVRESIKAWLKEGIPSGSPKQGYLICATPRSGSYFLCDVIRSTGCMGRPHEFFEAGMMKRLGRTDYPEDIPGQIAAAQRLGATSNGYYGAKFFPAQIDGAALAAIREGFSDPPLIHLTRRDLLGQAISLTRAALSRQFFSGPEGSVAPEFDADLIRDYLERIVHWNAAWDIYFARTGIEPLRVIYEDLVDDPQSQIDRMAEALGLHGEVRLDPSRLSMRVQRDALSAEWRERFLAAQPSNLFETALRSEGAARRARRLRRIARLLGLRSKN